jgi:hypothetical protein
MYICIYIIIVCIIYNLKICLSYMIHAYVYMKFLLRLKLNRARNHVVNMFFVKPNMLLHKCERRCVTFLLLKETV